MNQEPEEIVIVCDGFNEVNKELENITSKYGKENILTHSIIMENQKWKLTVVVNKEKSKGGRK